jgi:hypothetical protein
MKKILVLCFGLFLCSVVVVAQTSAEDTEHTNETSKGEKMKALLGLNDEQTTKFRAVVVERRAAIKAVKDDAALAADAKETKLKAIDATREEKFKAIFTPEQFEKWKAHNEQKKKD